MWQTPYGDTPEAGPSDTLRGNVFPKSGFVILGTGLVVFVDNQSKFYALDEKTGKVLFTKDVPNGATGVPAVYQANGREYLLFALTAGPAFSANSAHAARRRHPTRRPQELRRLRASPIESPFEQLTFCYPAHKCAHKCRHLDRSGSGVERPPHFVLLCCPVMPHTHTQFAQCLALPSFLR